MVGVLWSRIEGRGTRVVSFSVAQGGCGRGDVILDAKRAWESKGQPLDPVAGRRSGELIHWLPQPRGTGGSEVLAPGDGDEDGVENKAWIRGRRPDRHMGQRRTPK